MRRATRVTHITYSLEHGGAEVMILDLLRGLSREAFETSVCSFQNGGSLRKYFEKNEIPVFDIVKAHGKDATLPWRLYRFFKRQKTDIIHAHNGYMWLYSALPAKLAGAKILYTEHSVWENPSVFYLMGSKILEQITDRIVVPSKYVRKLLSEKQHVNLNNVEVIYNGIDLARIQRKVDIISKRKELGLDPKGKVIGIIARLVPVKNHKVLIEAMKIVCSKIGSSQLLIVGDGELRNDLEEMVLHSSLEKHVHFLGNRTDVHEILPTLDLFVLCSDSEGFPISLIEAMAAGVPVLATSVGGIPEAIEQNVTGKLVSKRNPIEMAQGIIDLLTNPGQASFFKEEALRKVRKDFSLEMMVSRYSEIYEELIRNRKEI